MGDHDSYCDSVFLSLTAPRRGTAGRGWV